MFTAHKESVSVAIEEVAFDMSQRVTFSIVNSQEPLLIRMRADPARGGDTRTGAKPFTPLMLVFARDNPEKALSATVWVLENEDCKPVSNTAGKSTFPATGGAQIPPSKDRVKNE